MKKIILFAALAFLIPNAVINSATVPDDSIIPPLRAITIFDTTLSNETAVATSKNPVTVPLRSIMLLQLSAVAENAGTNTVTASFNTSLDGTRWTTGYPYSGVITLNGTNSVNAILTIGTNINGIYISLDKLVTAQTNLVTLSSPIVTFAPSD